MISEILDELQKEFIQLYRKIENEEFKLKLSFESNNSLWSSSAMFNMTPLHIERARGNLTKEKILNERPKNIDRISESLYKDDEIIGVKFWKKQELIGLANYLKIDNNTIKTKQVIIDDDVQELVSISYYYKNDQEQIVKMIKAHRSGATLEEYEYINGMVSKLIIHRRDEFEVMDNTDGITKSPITKIIYKTEYNSSGKLMGIIDEKGVNTYRKPKYKTKL